jgi:hypothetical protein
MGSRVRGGACGVGSKIKAGFIPRARLGVLCSVNKGQNDIGGVPIGIGT